MRNFSIPLLSSILLYSLFFLLFPLSMYAMLKNLIYLSDWTFFSSSASPMNLTLIFDAKGLLFSSVVTFISANVMIFSNSYMKGDPYLARFIHLVLLFVASMNFLIYIPNLMSLLLGWDGLGLVSFLLVIYYQNPKSLSAGMITALTNRIGDVLILLSIAWTLNQSQWNLMFFSFNNSSAAIIIALMMAAMTKSAQMPFSSWLPAAMAAPTPVSALVHSSTLVTAGVFILVRFYPFLSTLSYFNTSLIIIATLTTLMAGLSANTECDMKKIIALSTLSQLGVMMISLGLGLPLFAFFHLLTHALFKALLFLCAGTIIHLHLHSQDLRFMGNLTSSLPSISAALVVSNLALCGTPFLAGFYSKDLILEFSLSMKTSLIVVFLFFLATSLTVSYTVRFLLAVVWGPVNLPPLSPVTDGDLSCTLSTAMLALGAILGGSSMNWLMMSPFIEPILPLGMKTLALSVSFAGLLMGYTFSCSMSSNKATLFLYPKFNNASCTMWFLAPLSTQKILPMPLATAHLTTKSLDQGWEELLGGQGIFTTLYSSGAYINSPQSYMTTSYMTAALILIPLTAVYSL
uniref:NADH-ubiquinone oxidoreductase chain 5 n=1 Tax=Prionospio multibranchiata TaxID=3050093 RepID=A0AAU6QGG3_9ANNE